MIGVAPHLVSEPPGPATRSDEHAAIPNAATTPIITRLRLKLISLRRRRITDVPPSGGNVPGGTIVRSPAERPAPVCAAPSSSEITPTTTMAYGGVRLLC